MSVELVRGKGSFVAHVADVSSADVDAMFRAAEVKRFRFKAWRWFVPDSCEECGEREGVAFESSRTMYDWDGVGVDPNRPIKFCRSCAADHHAYWDERWQSLRDNAGV